MFTPQKAAEACYAGLGKLAEFVEDELHPVFASLLQPDSRERAILQVYYGSIGATGSLRELSDHRHFQAIAASTRLLFEQLIDIKWLDANIGADSAEKFHEFPTIQRIRKAERIIEFCEQAGPQTTIKRATFDNFVTQTNGQGEVASALQRLWGADPDRKRTWPQHWSGVNSLEERSKRVGFQYLEFYIRSFPMLNWQIHGDPSAISQRDENYVINMCACSLHFAFEFFHDATRSVARCFHADQGIPDLHQSLDESRCVIQQIIEANHQKSIHV